MTALAIALLATLAAVAATCRDGGSSTDGGTNGKDAASDGVAPHDAQHDAGKKTGCPVDGTSKDWSLTLNSQVVVGFPMGFSEAAYSGDWFLLLGGLDKDTGTPGLMRIVSSAGKITAEEPLPRQAWLSTLPIGATDPIIYGDSFAVLSGQDVPKSELDEVRFVTFGVDLSQDADVLLDTTSGGRGGLARVGDQFVAMWICDQEEISEGLTTCLTVLDNEGAIVRGPIRVDLGGWVYFDEVLPFDATRVAAVGLDGIGAVLSFVEWETAEGTSGVETHILGPADNSVGSFAAASANETVVVAWESSGPSSEPRVSVVGSGGPAYSDGVNLSEGQSAGFPRIESVVPFGSDRFAVFWLDTRARYLCSSKDDELFVRIVDTKGKVVSPELRVPLEAFGDAGVYGTNNDVEVFWTGKDFAMLGTFFGSGTGAGELILIHLSITEAGRKRTEPTP